MCFTVSWHTTEPGPSKKRRAAGPLRAGSDFKQKKVELLAYPDLGKIPSKKKESTWPKKISSNFHV